MHRPHVTFSSRLLILSTLALLAALAIVAFSSRPAHGDPESPAAFHLAEITKLMVGFNGDTDIQAVEIKMIGAGENFVTAMEIATYDGSGNLLATLGTFAASIPNGLTGDNILCATAKFRDTFGITPDLLITPGLLVTSGQVAYEKETCRVNSLAYGNVPVPLLASGPTAAPPLPSQGAAALVRTVDDATSPFCPLSENSGARFALRTGSPTNPIVFRNNARQTVNVFSTITGAEGSPPAHSALRASPNPSRGSTRIEAPDWGPLSIHDIQGRLVRVLTCAPGGACPAVAGPFRGEWDGTDIKGREVPSGIYFLRHVGRGGLVVKRIALIR
jgi:hypothetical protein